MRGRVRSAIAAQRYDDGHAVPIWSQRSSHFSAVLDQHCPQAVKFSWYESSTAKSRRGFLKGNKKNSNGGGVGKPLQFVWGPPEGGGARLPAPVPSAAQKRPTRHHPR